MSVHEYVHTVYLSVSVSVYCLYINSAQSRIYDACMHMNFIHNVCVRVDTLCIKLNFFCKTSQMIRRHLLDCVRKGQLFFSWQHLLSV